MAARGVLYVHSSAGRYGADKQLELIARGLDPERYRAIVALPFVGELSHSLRAAGVEVVVRPLAVARRAGMSPGGVARTFNAHRADGRELGELARQRAVALVHSNTSVVLGGRAVARAARIPHVWHVREIYAGTPYARLWPAWRRVVTSADAVVCVSDATARQFTGARVVRDGVVLPDPPPGDHRARFGVPEGALAVAMLSRVSDWKGQSLLISALARGPGDAVALIAGSTWPGEEHVERSLRELAASRGLSERVRFLGEIADPEALYAACDIVAVPSLRPDPFPNTALEAGLAGRPVVAARHGGLPEIVVDGQTGLLFTPGDAPALAQALATLASEPALRARMGAAARERAVRDWSPERMVAEIQALYDELPTSGG